MKKHFSDPLLREMLKEKGGLCVSVLIPMYKISPERRQNPLRVKKAVEEAKSKLEGIRLNDKGQAALVRKISDSLTEHAAKINFVHSGKGAGIFVSENLSETVYFPFPITERVVIGDSFETRDLLYKEHYMAEYLVLAFTLNSCRLFRGRDGVHEEVKDKNFPKEYKDTYTYEKSSRAVSYGYSLKTTEKDKSVMKLVRLKEFYRSVDTSLTEYLTGSIPVVITGVAKALGSFLEVTTHQKSIISQIAGNYSDQQKREFEMRTWKKVLEHQKDAEKALIKDLDNKYRTKQLVTGIKEIWKSVNEGRGLLLVVEKDFRQSGFEKKNGKKMVSHPPASPDFKVMQDAVDDLIELVLEKNGEVSFVQNGALKKMQRMALLTRY